ncbi:MAG: branched-chain-amino-acid transaminase [Brevinematales bacterium]|jgi:branched-chain amino acid aminotransferase
MKIYIDGKYFGKDEAKISVFDHGYLYGDGVFEGIRAYSGKIFKLNEHITRLYKSAKAILLDLKMSPQDMEKAVYDTFRENKRDDAYIRLVVSRGSGDLGVNPANCKVPSVVIIVGEVNVYPKEFYDNGITAMTSSVRRVAPDTFDVRIKSMNYLNNSLAKIEAINAGCMEAIILNHNGFVSECTGENIFIFSDGVLKTPGATDSALEGITRNFVLELARAGGMKAMETHLTQYDLYTSDECFLTGTGAELMPVTMIDGREIGDGKPGKNTKALIELFHKEIRKI